MSAAAVMLVNGTNGKRYCTPNARVMLHKISSGNYGNFDDLDTHMKEVTRLEEKFESFIVKKTKFNKKTLKKALENDFYMDAEQAKQKGVIDKVITSFADLKLQGW